jgi:SAM-dependent methyltransferase
MPLMEPDRLAELLSCPTCRSPLRSTGLGFICSDGQCAMSKKVFPAAGGQPVLVDFADSILAEDEVLQSGGGSAILRGGGMARKSAVLRTMLPSNDVAENNARRLLALAKQSVERPVLLVVGGGSPGEGTAHLYDDPSIDLVGFDIYASPITQFIADAHRIPLTDESVDAVWIQAVLEHVLDPWAVVAEIHRVLTHRGVVYAETPFMQQVHEGPYDFTRFTESGHRWLFRKFDLIDSGVALGPATQFLWSVDHLVRSVLRSVRAGVLAKLALFWIKYFDRLADPRHAADSASAVYFLGRKSDRTLGPREMIAHYKGAHSRR